MFTLGKLFFWVLPNLDNEKCGFFESFKPLYSIEWKKDKTRRSKKTVEQNGEKESQEQSGTDTTEKMESESKAQASEDS